MALVALPRNPPLISYTKKIRKKIKSCKHNEHLWKEPSVMKIIKTDRRNKMDNEWLNDLMICNNEKEIFKTLDDDAIMKRFQALKHRRMNLSQPARRT
ncbi:unnamed protein product [Urochloa humidicola]